MFVNYFFILVFVNIMLILKEFRSSKPPVPESTNPKRRPTFVANKRNTNEIVKTLFLNQSLNEMSILGHQLFLLYFLCPVDASFLRAHILQK